MTTHRVRQVTGRLTFKEAWRCSCGDTFSSFTRGEAEALAFRHIGEEIAYEMLEDTAASMRQQIDQA